MRSLISERVALWGTAVILSGIVVFHLLVLLRVIPYDIVWGGRLTSEAQMVSFETVSILVNSFMLLVLALRAGVVPVRVPPLVLRLAFGLMAGLFALNTVGNLLSTNSFETWTFTPLTLLLAVFSLRLAMGSPQAAA